MKFRLKSYFLESIRIDLEPKMNCEKIYSHFLNKINGVIYNQSTIQDPHHTTYHDVKNIWDHISFQSNKVNSNINFEDSIDYNIFKGSFLTLASQGEQHFIKRENIRPTDISTIVMGGIDFDSMRHFGALRKNLFSFFDSIPDIAPMKNINQIHFYFPLHNKKLRYHELMQFHSFPNYTSEEMKNLALQYIIPKIEQQQPITFFCYSAACREVMMIENACREYFNTQCIQENKVKEMMSCVNAVLIGYAFDWSETLHKARFNKLILLSIEDFAILRTKFNRELIYGSSTLTHGVTLIHRDETQMEKALIFGNNTVPIQLNQKINWQGHSLSHYIHSFRELISHDHKAQLMHGTNSRL